jgi:hypothetical protein
MNAAGQGKRDACLTSLLFMALPGKSLTLCEVRANSPVGSARGRINCSVATIEAFHDPRISHL